MSRSSPSTIALVFNPSARAGRAGARLERVAAELSRSEFEVSVHTTAGRGHGVELARAAARAGADVVVAAGGDGTVNEVVNGLVLASDDARTAPLLAVLPLGGGNDVAANTSAPRGVDGLLAALRRGETSRLDVGRLRIGAGRDLADRYFANELGVGLGARVNAIAAHVPLGGRMRYLAAAIVALGRGVRWTLALRAETPDGAVVELSMGPRALVSVGNGARCGGGFHLTPGAKTHSGLFEVLIVAAMPRWQLLGLLPRALRGTHVSDPRVRLLCCRAVKIESDEPLPLHVDGEIIEAGTAVDVSVLPSRLHIVGRSPEP